MTEKRNRSDHDLGQEEVEKNLQEEQDKGYRGNKIDPTPNSHYTVAGVTSGKPTPETDEKAFEEAQRASRGR